MAINNLPGIFENVLDGKLTLVPVNDAPTVLILGTASKGVSETLFRVDRPSDAAKSFGKDGTLIRGMYEASIAGALNMRLFRIGATAAVLDGVGAGLTITTVSKDDSSGTDYTLFWDDSVGRLYVYRADDDTLVYDNSPSDPSSAVDLQEVTVDGDFDAGSSADIGTSGTPIPLEDADGVAGATYTAG